MASPNNDPVGKPGVVVVMTIIVVFTLIGAIGGWAYLISLIFGRT